MNGGMDIIVKRIPDAISIPAKAVFTRAGKPVVYLSRQGRYTPVDVQVLARNPDEVAVSGIAAGALVALADPEKSERRNDLIVSTAAIAAVAALVWGGLRVVQLTARDTASETPVTSVKKGCVTIVVAARGELQGGNSEVLTAPMVGGGEMAITYLTRARRSGQDRRRRCAVRHDAAGIQPAGGGSRPRRSRAAGQEGRGRRRSRARRSPLPGRVNDVRRQAGRARGAQESRARPASPPARTTSRWKRPLNRQTQAQRDLENKKATATAGDRHSEGGRRQGHGSWPRPRRRTIESMVLKARTSGYVNVQANSNQNSLYYGQQLPPFQVGDTSARRQAVAQIPDMSSWEVSARIPEADRGHLAPGQKVSVRAAAIPGRAVQGACQERWGKHGIGLGAQVRMPHHARRNGAGAASGHDVEHLDHGRVARETCCGSHRRRSSKCDGRSSSTRDGRRLHAHDVTLVRRSESQAVITGINEGDVVALSNPDQQSRSGNSSQPAGAMKALAEMILLSGDRAGVCEPARPEDANAADGARHRVRRRDPSSA